MKKLWTYLSDPDNQPHFQTEKAMRRFNLLFLAVVMLPWIVMFVEVHAAMFASPFIHRRINGDGIFVTILVATCFVQLIAGIVISSTMLKDENRSLKKRIRYNKAPRDI